MQRKQRKSAAGIGLICLIAGAYLFAAAAATPQQRRDDAAKAFKDGNFKVAYETIRPVLLDRKADAKKVPADLDLAINSLRSLGRVDEVDGLLEAAVVAHAENWRLLQAAALSYQRGEHFGYVVAGKFNRGHGRG